jgi:uncharacterized protein
MKTDFKARRLDVMAFAEAGADLVGELSLTTLPRLLDSLHRPLSDAPAPVARWQARGSLHTIRGGTRQARLHLQVQASAPLECQRCLDTVDTPLEVDRQFVFAATEEAAAALDEDEEDDVLVLSRHFDLIELVEDELLLALPVVPRHAHCPRDLSPGGEVSPPPDVIAPTEADRPHPFAALAALKVTKDGEG